ncbi:MAG: hypothetical protein H6728_04390 [Myxococcales bacterium]|nr:hypothetical protein [Myxococcales bacterium]MCB9642291.1 hypothetical protein [Myxococcales bacterium]
MRVSWKRAMQLLVCTFCLSFVLSSCGVIGGGGGGGENERKFADQATYRVAASGKTIVFDPTGNYQYYFSLDNFTNKQPTVSSKYTILGSEIVFKKDDGTDYESRGLLATGDATFTWAEHPDETFTKVTE